MSDSNTINVITDPKDQTIRLLSQLGVGLSKSVRTLPKNGQGGIQGAVSLEQVGRLEASALVIAYASPALRRQLESNRVFKNMSVVKRRAYSEMDLADDHGVAHAVGAVCALRPQQDRGGVEQDDALSRE